MKHYERFQDELILRDYLAADRTRLANERTLLSYVRTGIGVLAAGIGLEKFTDSRLLIAMGIVLEALSPLIVAYGIYRYIRVGRRIKSLDVEMFQNDEKRH